MTKLVFLDLETTGLDPGRHEPWEIGLIVREEQDTEYLWQIRPDLTTADPNGLRIGRYYERSRLVLEHPGAAMVIEHPVRSEGQVSNAWIVAAELAKLLDGATIIGAVPSFDAAFLSRWLPAHGQAFTAHYHLQDVETLVMGFLAGTGQTLELPLNSDTLSLAVGIDPAEFDRHTALGDCAWVRAQWDAVMRHTTAD